MTEAAKAARREYYRAWAKNNPEKVRKARERFWERVAAGSVTEADKTRQKPTENGRNGGAV